MTAKTLDALPAAASVGAGDVVLVRQGGISKKADVALFAAAGAVTSVAGRTGAVVLAKSDVGLPNVDNTSDANKPVSTAQAAADAAVLAASAPIAHVGAGGGAHANVVASGAAGFMTGADKAKLDGVASGATANTGTVTSTSVVSANGFAGSVATATTTPAITVSTTVTGLVKGNGTALAAATVRTDYAEPTTALATGILKNTSGTGAHTIAVAGDFPTLNQNTTGSAASLTTARTIGGSSFNGTANVTSFPVPGPIGGTTPSTGAFTTLSATGNVTLGDATTDTLNVGNGGLIKDAAGNVGIGVTPIEGVGSLQFPAGNQIGSHGDNFHFTSASKYVAGWLYASTGTPALRYEQLAGNHSWYTAPAGTADSPITFTQAMTLNASGNLRVSGTVTAPTFSGALSGSIAAATGLTSGQVVTALGYTPSAAASRTVSVISTNTTAVSGTTYVLTASLVLNLPASPTAGAYIMFSNRSGTTTATIARNGQNIMGLAEDLTIDGLDYSGELMFADATRGWVLL